MAKKEQEVESKNKTNAMTITFNAMVVTKEGVDAIEFVKSENEFFAEPRSSNGCVVVFKIDKCELKSSKRLPSKLVTTNEEGSDTSTAGPKNIYFSFRGVRFSVDTETSEVECNAFGTSSEMKTDKAVDGLYKIKTIT